jgi:hypothetical protein
MKKYILFLIGLFMIYLVNASLGIIVTPLDSDNNTMPNSAFNYVFNFTINSNCTNVLLSYSTTIVTLPQGSNYISINISNLTQQPNNLCVYRDGVLEDNLTFNDLILNSLMVNNINASGNITANYFHGKLNYSDIQNVPPGTNFNNNTDNVNYWIGMNSTNSTQIQNNGGVLNILVSWLNSLFYQKSEVDNNLSLRYLGTNPNNFVNVTSITNTTIVRSGSYNCSSGMIPQNITINSSGIFSSCIIQNSGDNSSWNQSLANTLYYGINNTSNFINGSVCYQNGTNCNNYLNVTTISNTTIVRNGNYNCSSNQVIQNITINSSGAFGMCMTPTATINANSTTLSWKNISDWSSGTFYNSSYLTSSYNLTYDAFYNTNNTIVRKSNYNCSSNQVLMNVTVNSSGIFGMCVNQNTAGNSSWNQTFANTLYTNFSSFNSTQMSYTNGYINILTSWLTTFINSFNFITFTNLTNLGSNNINGSGNINMKNFNSTGNITMINNGTFCYNLACSAYEYWNGTVLIRKVN